MDFRIARVVVVAAADCHYAVARIESPAVDSVVAIMKAAPDGGWSGAFLGTSVDPADFPPEVAEAERRMWTS